MAVKSCKTAEVIEAQTKRLWVTSKGWEITKAISRDETSVKNQQNQGLCWLLCWKPMIDCKQINLYSIRLSIGSFSICWLEKKSWHFFSPISWMAAFDNFKLTEKYLKFRIFNSPLCCYRFWWLLFGIEFVLKVPQNDSPNTWVVLIVFVLPWITLLWEAPTGRNMMQGYWTLRLDKVSTWNHMVTQISLKVTKPVS